MSLLRTSLGGALLVILVTPPMAFAGGETRSPDVAQPTPAQILSSNRVIVEWAPGASHTDRVATRDGAGVDFASDLGNRRFQLVEVEPGQTASAAARELEADPSVLVAEPDGYSAPNSIPNDPLFGELWGLHNSGTGIGGVSDPVAGSDVNAPAAWDRTIGEPSTVIADIDSGYRFNDPELSSVAWTNAAEASGTAGVDDDGNGYVDDLHGYDFVGTNADSPSSDSDPTDDNLISGGHGIHTAGTIGAAGDNGVGITGVAQNARIMALRVCANSAAAGNETRCPFSSEVAAINYAGANHARAANMSLGGTFLNTTERDAIAANPGTLYVISAGNDAANNDTEPHYPCSFDPLAEGKSAVDNVICVAATDQADQLASFSDWGANSVDLGAPGTQILSTFPAIEESFHDDFEANDFATVWSQTGTRNFGRAGAGDGPLTSFGMSDSPGETPLPSTQYDTTMTSGVAIPSGSGACTVSGTRYRNGGSGGTFFYEVQSDGVEAFKNTSSAATGGSEMVPFHTVPILGLAGHSVKLRFDFVSGPSPVASNGLWLDDLEISCYKPVTAPLAYAFLQGTSMAAPHVTGAAALLFTLKPLATVTEVRNALLTGVDAIPSLAGKTTTGGRLDIAKAIESLEGATVDNSAPAKPTLSGTVPESGSNENHPKVQGSAEAGSTVALFKSLECGGKPLATGTAAQLGGAGIEISVPDNSITFLSAQATDAARNKSSCSAAISYLEDSPEVVEPPPREFEEAQRKIEQANPPAAPQLPAAPACRVPKLIGKALSKATAALVAAHCSLGTVAKPKARKGHKLGPLVVKSSNPAPGSASSSGKVNLTLGPKPKPKKHRH